MVLVACGPYTPSDSLTFDPLLDLINVIVRDRPDVCILVQSCLSDESVVIMSPLTRVRGSIEFLFLCSWDHLWTQNMNKLRYFRLTYVLPPVDIPSSGWLL